MDIVSAKYSNGEKRYINVQLRNGNLAVAVREGNSMYREVLQWVEEGNEIAAPDKPTVSSADVRIERQRRIYLIADPDKQAFYQRLMISWLEQGKDTWTPEQIVQVAAIRAGNQAIDAIVAKANELEAMEPIPTDYTDDKWWS